MTDNQEVFNIISSFEIRNLVESELKKSKLFEVDFDNITPESLYSYKELYTEYDSNKDAECLSINCLKNIQHKLQQDLSNHSTELGNSRIRFLQLVSNNNWYSSTFNSIKSIIGLPNPNVSPVPISPPVPPVVIDIINFNQIVISELNKQITNIQKIDQLPNIRPNYDHEDKIQTDISKIFELYNNFKQDFESKKSDYIKTIVKYIKLQIYKKIFEKLVQFRKLSCPEEAENSM